MAASFVLYRQKKRLPHEWTRMTSPVSGDVFLALRDLPEFEVESLLLALCRMFTSRPPCFDELTMVYILRQDPQAYVSVESAL